ncbi:MAG: TatD family hydrolase [Patescibacteria group bacterium]|jgi:Tat protein secretion system quality control protein TatD with DNase activity
MLIDTHAHLNFRAYDIDREEIVTRCAKKGMAVVNVGAQYQTSKSAAALALKNENFYATVGLHPIHAFDEIFDAAAYESLLNPKVVGIGECGLDYWWFKYLKEPYKIVLLHGWGGSKDERFFIWLDEELTKLGHTVIRFNFPDTDNPNQEAWLKEISKQVGYVNGKTLLVGFSLGGVSILRFLEQLDEDATIAGAYLLGTPAQNPGYPEIKDFFKTDFDWQHINSVCKNFNIYSSTNDEVVPAEHGLKLAEKLKTEVKSIKDAWHFNLETIPELLININEDIIEVEKNLPTIEGVIKKQEEIFIQQIKFAQKYNLALMLHGRNGLEGRDVYAEMLEILKKEKIERAVFHCYGGTLAMAQQIVKAGYYIGIDGPVTYKKKSEELQTVVKEIPLSSLLLETDACGPYLTPEPYRGQRNEPIYIELIASKVAELKGLSKDEVIEQTWQNAKKLFKI